MQNDLKNQKLNQGANSRQLCLTAGLALGVFGLIFLIRDLFPLGDGSILMIDLHSQYMPLLYRFYDVVTGQKNLFMDLSASGGAYLYADTINEVLNPFNYILLLFGREKIYLAANVLLACYGTAAAVTVCFCLQRLWPEKREWNVSLSLMYVFSGFMGAQFQIIKWLYLFVLFPLFILALVRLLREKKWGFYALLLGYQLMLSLQLGAMLLLFALFGSAFYFLYEKKKHQSENDMAVGAPERRKKIRALAVGTIVGLMISAVVLIPNVLQLLGSARGSENLSYLSVMKRHGLEDLFERIFLIANPVLFVTGGFLLLEKRGGRADKKVSLEVKALLIWNGFLWLTVVLQPSNLLWHLGSYMCFPVRYAYMIVFSEVLLVKEMVPMQPDGVPEQVHGKKYLKICSFSAMILFLAAAAVLTVIWAVPISQGFSSLAVSTVTGAVIRIIGILGLMAVAALFAVLCGRWKKAAVTVSVCVMGCIYFLFVMLPQDYPVRQMNEKAYQEMNQSAVRTMDESDFSHREEVDGWPLNSTLVSGGRAMTGYFPSGSGKEYAAAMEKLGYLTPWVSTRSWGGTAISDSVLGIERNTPEGFENRILTEGCFLTEDVLALQELYAEIGDDNPLQAQKILGQMLVGQEVLEVVDMNQLPEQEENHVVIELSEKSILYLDAAETAADMIVWVNGEKLEIPEEMSAESPHRIYTLGYFEEGSVSVCITDRSQNPLPDRGRKIGILNWNQWNEAVQEPDFCGKQNLKIDDRNAKLSITVNQPGTLLLPAAYTDGWKVKQNGQKAEPAVWAEGFLGVEVPEESLQNGTAEVVFSFIPPGILIGIVLTAAGIAIVCAAFIRKKFQKEADAEKNVLFFGGFYLAVLAAGVLGVYIIPNAGLAVNIAMRMLGLELTEEAAEQPEVRIAQISETDDGILVNLVEENLMLQKGVRVKADSEENKEFSADLVKDGISDVDSNRWSSENNWENNEHWLQVDFRKDTQIVCVKLFWERTNACEYALEYSADQKDWKTIASFTETAPEKEQTIFLEEPVQARYLRLHVWDVIKEEEDLSLYYQNVSLKEMEVYGETAGSILIEKPVIGKGQDRVLDIPVLSDGYALRFGGADYENLIDENGKIADTLSAVEAEIGFVLTKGNLEWELPGMKTEIPASDPAEREEAADESIINSCVAEWKADGGSSILGSDPQILISVGSGQKEETAELLQEMAELFRTELSTDTALDHDTKSEDISSRIDRIRFILETEEDNRLGEEGCEIQIGKQEILVKANSAQGIRWGCVTLLDLLKESEVLPLGTLRDYPRYEVRGFGIDVGRRAVSMDLLYKTVKELSAQKMNTLQIHLNDNQIISQSEYDGTVEGARKLYAGFRLESDMKNEDGVGITSADLYYTKAEFMQLIEDAKVYGVEIIPEIDTPAHSLALTKVFPELGMSGDPEAADMLDLSKATARQIGMEIWKEYLSESNGVSGQAVFAECQALHLGMDEYFGNAKDYLAYLKELSDYVYSLAPEKELRIWGSLTMKGGDLSGISRDLQMHIWDVQWADPADMYAEGFQLINSLSRNLYLIPGGGYDWLDTEYLETEWQPNVYETPERTWVIPAWSDQCLGACYMMWNDWASVNGEEITEEGLFDRFREPLPVIADKLW